MSVLYDSAETIQTTLQGITFSSQDDEVGALAASAIVIRKLARRERDFERGYRLEQTPGWLIVPQASPSPPSAGVNTHDDVFYQIDLVLFGRDYEREAGLETYTHWLQQARQKLNDPTIAWPSNASTGIVWHVKVTNSDSIADWPWAKLEGVVSGLRVQLTSREPRG